MPGLFDGYQLKGLTLRNRVGMSPMCQYMAEAGVPNEWHLVHCASRAIGGVGLVIMEMTNVEARGRISDQCLGLWNDEQQGAFARVVDSVKRHGAAIGLQLAHAGRKSRASGTTPVAPSAIAFDDKSRVPSALATAEVEALVEAFGQSAARAVSAGFELIELHGAHGYLIHQFLSPASNRREDRYGQGERFLLEVIAEVRRQLPNDFPLALRLSAVDGHQDGYSFDGLLALAPAFLAAGVDLLDLSSGGNGPVALEAKPGYNVGFARAYRERLGCPVMAVGRLEDPLVAEGVLREEAADLVLIGRGLLRNPHWVREAAEVLAGDFRLPGPYERAFGAVKR